MTKKRPMILTHDQSFRIARAALRCRRAKDRAYEVAILQGVGSDHADQTRKALDNCQGKLNAIITEVQSELNCTCLAATDFEDAGALGEKP